MHCNRIAVVSNLFVDSSGGILMSTGEILQIILYFVLLAALTPVIGKYIAAIFLREKKYPGRVYSAFPFATLKRKTVTTQGIIHRRLQ